MDDFIKINRAFLTHYPLKNGGKKLLVEEMNLPMIAHMNAIFALILNQAYSYQPVWLKSRRYQDQLAKSYCANAQIAAEPKFISWLKFYAAIAAVLKYPKIWFTGNILAFNFDGVKYGDIVYDNYLYSQNVATIKKINLKLIKGMASCIFRHLKIKAILKSDNYAGVLVSHQVGIRSGVLLRTALRYGYHGYFRFDSILCDYRRVEEIYDYPLKPTSQEVDKIINQLGPKLETVFQQTLEKHVTGLSTKDGLHAFDKNKPLYSNRQQFNTDFKLVPNQKNIFIMLHAFIDSPHSHFKWMIFKDYYDWFYQTLQFAKKNPQFNWIFKQHPSNKYYQSKDVDFNQLFADAPKNIIYIDEEHQIDTRSLIYCADLVITCLGSAGFEIPAMCGIPSITAADTFYSGLGFAQEPKNQTEYLQLLSQADKIGRLTFAQQQRAKAAFIYIREYALPQISARPKLSFAEEKDKKINDWYWPRVANNYITKKSLIIKEIDNYINQVKRHDFKKITSLNELFDLAE